MIENNTKHSLTIGFIKKFGQTKFCSVRQNLEFCQMSDKTFKYFNSTDNHNWHILYIDIIL